MKPFLKWAGGKYRIIDHIKTILPEGKRLIEPFAGSTAVFLNTTYPSYLLSDTNADLIHLYQQVQAEGEKFIATCRGLFDPIYNNPETYYAFRDEFNRTTDIPHKSALFLYLNRHCYNGLCRYNSRGEFNVPFGSYKRPYFPLTELRYFHHKAQSATFLHADFGEAMYQAQPGDVIYCDPPYVPLSPTSSFTSYSPNNFGPLEHLRLAETAETIVKRGIPVVISNHSTPFTHQTYTHARITTFDVRRFISCNGSTRSKVTELLALFS
jgi:DNA adenine methylase